MFHSNSSNLRSLKKNVSWTNVPNESEEKIHLRTTPFPNINKRRKISNSTPVTLRFDDRSESELSISSKAEENYLNYSSAFSDNLMQVPQRKRSNSSNSSWEITNCKMQQPCYANNVLEWKETNLLLEPEYDSTVSDSSLDNTSSILSYSLSNSDSSGRTKTVFDSNRKLAKEIQRKLQKHNTNQNSNFISEALTDEYSDTEFSIEYPIRSLCSNNSLMDSKEIQTNGFEISTVDDNSELLTCTLLDSMDNFSNTESDESESSIEECFNFRKLNKKSCKIIKLPNQEQKNPSRGMKIKKEKKLKLIDSRNNFTQDRKEYFNNDITEIENNMFINESRNLLESENRIRNLVRYRIFEKGSILILKHPLKLYFSGKLSISVLSGAIEILGHEIQYQDEKAVDVYSPRGNCFLCIETLGTRGNNDLTSLLKQFNITNKEIEELFAEINETDCVIVVKDIKNPIIQYLNKHVAQQLFPKINPCNNSRPLAELETKIQCLLENEPKSWKIYRKNNEWDSIVHDILNSKKELGSRTILCGGKSVGKSLLLRYTINRLLNDLGEVVCIDLDVGQPEFTIPGCLSVSIINKPIFGPNYTHITKPVKSFFLGDLNVMQCLTRYINCVTNLLMYCNENVDKRIPWIVNCMGFTKSLGADIIVSVIRLVAPTLIVQIQSERDHRNYDSLLNMDFVKTYKNLLSVDTQNVDLEYTVKVIYSVAEEIVPGEWQIEPRNLREMSILSYFGQMLSNSVEEIITLSPYIVHLSSVKLKHAHYSDSKIHAVINGNLVALCSDSNEDECYGFGIVRGIDMNNKYLYLVTPLPQEELENVKCLSMGTVTLPPSIYMTPGQHEGLVPYISLGIREGTSIIPKRSYLMARKVLLRKNNPTV